MKRIRGLLFCQLLFLVNCGGSPTPYSGSTTANTNGNAPAYRPAFIIGDQVSVFTGDYAPSNGTVAEVDLEAGGYLIKLSDRPNPVFIRSYMLRKNAPVVPPARPQPALEPAPANSYPPQQPPPQQQQPQPGTEVQPPVEQLPVSANSTSNGKLGRIAVLPVIGPEEYVAETLAWHIANEQSVHTNFHVVPITPHIRRNVLSEASYTAIYNAGEDVNADFILTSFIRFIGCQQYFISAVLNTQTRELVAGDYRRFDDIQDIPAFFAPMTRRMMSVTRSKNAARNLPTLSVELMALPPNKDGLLERETVNDAAILTQLLAITMANTNTYAIYPRTDAIDDAILNYETQRSTASRVFINNDNITGTQYVMSSKLDMLAEKHQILAEIVDIRNSVLRKGSYLNFEIIEDVPSLISRLALQLATAQKAKNSP